MLETSQDIFYIVLAFCILWFTLFLCVTLYHLIRLLKQTNEVVTEVREKVSMLTNIFSFLKSDLVKKAFDGVVSVVKKKTAKNKKNKKQK